MKIKSIDVFENFNNKTVLLRADFNVPAKNKKIIDDYKIKASVDTIKFIFKKGGKIIILSHFGRPKGCDKKYSLDFIARRLEREVGEKVYFEKTSIDSKDLLKNIENKKEKFRIILLENLRFYKEEKDDSKTFAKILAGLADIYINDAFGVSHRKHASVSAIKKYLPSYAGLLVKDELMNLNKVLKPKKPLTLIIGGAKIKTKLPLLKRFGRIADFVLIGGGIANNFLLALGFKTGKSLTDKSEVDLSKKIASHYNSLGKKKIIVPVDVVVCRNKNGSGKKEIKSIKNIKREEYVFDIGPDTIKIFNSIVRKSQTIIWNGPLGFFEVKNFKTGTLAMAKSIASAPVDHFSVVGGGETIEALRMVKNIHNIDWVSTGGGAMISYLSGEKMPGLVGLIK